MQTRLWVTALHGDAVISGPWDGGAWVSPACLCQPLPAAAYGFLRIPTQPVTLPSRTKSLTAAAEAPARESRFSPQQVPEGTLSRAVHGETPTPCPCAQTSTQPQLCPGWRRDGSSRNLETAPLPAQLALCGQPARAARYCRSLCRQGVGGAGLTAARCPSPFVGALMHLMMNSQAFEKGLCLPETTTKYNKLKIAASLWNMPTSPTENPVERKFA